jgi:GDPmannose 4,6-dehydratase
MNKQKVAMITGVSGQDGSYLADLLLDKGYFVVGLKRRTSSINTCRIDHIINNQEMNKNFKMHYYDLMDGTSIVRLLQEYQPDEFYNLAAQSHVGVSFDLAQYTSDGIAMGAIKIMDGIRLVSPHTKFYQASSSEMFGDSKDFGENGFTEDSKMCPVSPYAAAKLYAHHSVRIYRNAYNLYASSGILFNHESPRRGETFVTRKITIAAAKIKAGLQDKLFLGNLDAVRDWGFAGDYVRAMWLMLQQDIADDYIVATQQTHSVRDFLKIVFEHADLGDYNKYVEIDPRLFRPNEVPYLLGNPTKAKTVLGWQTEYDMQRLAKLMFDKDYENVKSDPQKISSELGSEYLTFINNLV